MAEPPEPQAQRSEVGLATITLRQIRVSRADVTQDKTQDKPSSDANPMNRLVPYLDLFGRLSDEEIARLAGVSAVVANNLRRQVVQVDRALTRFTDLLPRLTDAELVRLTGASPKTIRFWRLCQPRFPMAGGDAQGWSVAQAADTLGRVQSSAELSRRSGSSTGTYQAMSDEPPLDSGAPLDPRHPSGELPRVGGRPAEGASAPHRLPTAERDAGSSAYRMPIAERDSGSSAQRMPTPERDSGSSAYRMPIAERDSGSSGAQRMPTPERRAPEVPPPVGTPTPRFVPLAPVDLSRPRTGRTEEVAAAQGSVVPPPPPTTRPPAVVHKQQAVAQQMGFSGAPFPGYDAEGSGAAGEDDGIFIGLELPDPRTLAQPGRRE